MRTHRHQRGSALVAVLLLITLILVAGLGLMSRKIVEYRRLQVDQNSAQALLLAQSGLQDALLKYGKDISFPPPSSADQTLFRYTEELYRTDGATSVGRYSVTVDDSLDTQALRVVLITSVGTVGPEEAPVARHTVKAELDMNPARATYMKLLNYQDMGGL